MGVSSETETITKLLLPFNFSLILDIYQVLKGSRDGSRTAATSKVELFVTIVNGWKPLTIIIKSSTLDIAAVLDPPLGPVP